MSAKELKFREVSPETYQNYVAIARVGVLSISALAIGAIIQGISYLDWKSQR